MTIAPLVRSVTVKPPPAQAFDLFTSQMERWWPAKLTLGRSPLTTLVLEPHDGGRWFERDADGDQTQWGRVLAWQPPTRLLLGWQIDAAFKYDPDLLTEVEITFAPADPSGTVVTLEHRDLERFGAHAARVAEQLTGGWSAGLEAFVPYADAHF